MNKIKTFFKPTKIATKLIRQIALIALASLLISFGLSYALFWPQLRDEAHDEAVSASRYIMLSIDETVKNLDGYADYMSSSVLLGDALSAYHVAPDTSGEAAVTETLAALKSISPNIRAVVLTGEDWVSFQTGQLGAQDIELLYSSWFVDCMNDTMGHNWSSLYVSDVGQPVDTLVRLSACELHGKRYVLSIFYDAGTLMDSIDSLAASTYTGYLLTDSHDGGVGRPFYVVGETGNASAIAARYYNELAYSARDEEGHYFLITIPTNEWRLVGFIDKATFNSALTPFIGLLFLICLVLGILIVLAFVPAVNRILSPLGQLKETMENVSDNGSDFYSPVQTDDEIGELSDVFNDMLDEMRISAEQTLAHQTREQHLTYNLMVSQINSHFFYNTLSVINSLARQGRDEDVVRANTALTTIFQDCLRPQSISVGDTVAQEKSIVECYWVIESLDPANESALHWDIPEELMEKRIPKNIIQPLVENALFHGLDDAETGKKSGWIHVSLRQEDGQLILRVRNNGLAIDRKMLARLNDPQYIHENGSHIGLANIRRRLNMIYDGRASLSIASDAETTVTVQMPDIL